MLSSQIAQEIQQEFLENSRKLTEEVMPQALELLGLLLKPSELSHENETLKMELEDEERWARQVALKVLESDQNILFSVLNSLWLLSQNVNNTPKILKNEETLRSIFDVLINERSRDLLAPCFGILSNCCQIPENIAFLLENQQEMVEKVLGVVRNVLKEPCNTDKALEATIAFTFNFSLTPEGSEALAAIFIVEAMTETLEQHMDEKEIVDMCEKTLSSILSQRNRTALIYMTAETVGVLNSVLRSQDRTTTSIELLVKLKTLFPSYI